MVRGLTNKLTGPEGGELLEAGCWTLDAKT